LKFLGNLNNKGNIIIKGVPFESISFSPGCALAPYFIRYCSESIELKSFYKGERKLNFEDKGDIPCFGIDKKKAIKLIEEESRKILKTDKIPIFLGGDHTITYPILKTFKKKYKSLNLLVLDAHTDFRRYFEGDELNHATWLNNLYRDKLCDKDEICILGVRENYPETPFKIINKDYIKNLKGKNLYISIDLDVLDHKEFTSLSNPTPFGICINDILDIVKELKREIKGMDMVEFNPLRGDPLLSGTLCAFLLREIIAVIG
jgi:agmatinase